MSDSTPPGHPGHPSRWTSSRKSGVGAAIGPDSPVWFTLGEGIVNEVYYPRLDCANLRDMGLLVSGPDGFFSDERVHTEQKIEPLERGVPGYRLVNTCEQGRYRITKTIHTDPARAALLMHVRFEALSGERGDYRVFVLAAPRVANQGTDDDAWLGEFRGVPLLYAHHAPIALALASSTGWRARGCGYVGVSDGWQQVRAHGHLAEEHPEARSGNIALTGELDFTQSDNCVVVLAFGGNADEAGHTARAALLAGPDAARERFIAEWREFQDGCLPLGEVHPDAIDLYRVSTAMLRTHESKLFRGGIIASLSIPWGHMRDDHDIGGYHLIWPRDLLHAGMGLLAAGRAEDARRAMFYLLCTQETEGGWPQNMWIDGRPEWGATQSDQTAGFVLLVDALRRHADLGGLDPWDAVRRAAAFMLECGPVTEQDRWEENRGHTPYTLALVISALLIAADLADEKTDSDFAARCRAAADDWHGKIDEWLYVTDTPLSRHVGVDGYYVRIGPADMKSPEDLRHLMVPLKNQTDGDAEVPAWDLVSPDALALVRYGLRRADDPRILNTVRVLDATVLHETANGPVWRRFTHDGYGEPDDGSPFTGAGVGRGWPVLTGERAHYELARGERDEAERLLLAMVKQSHEGGLLPEQIWDGDEMPELRLCNGFPTGAAMPLVWAHAEYIRLLRSLRDDAVFDLPPRTAERYLG